MSRARALTLGYEGPQRRRHRGGGRFPLPADYVTLRRLTRAADSPAVRTLLREVIERVGARPERMRYEEGAIYVAACTRYRDLTGEQIGPEQGTY